MVFLDLDGVIANFQDAVCDVHNKPNPYLDWRNHGQWNMAIMLGLSAKEFCRPLGFNFWFRMEKMPDAKRILSFIKMNLVHPRPPSADLPGSGPFESAEICFLSAPSPVPGCRDGKAAWVRRHYPTYPLIMCDSNIKCRLASPGAWLIDDKDSNVSEFITAGGKGILVPRPWNSLHEWCASTGSMLKSMYTQLNNQSSVREVPCGAN